MIEFKLTIFRFYGSYVAKVELLFRADRNLLDRLRQKQRIETKFFRLETVSLPERQMNTVGQS